MRTPTALTVAVGLVAAAAALGIMPQAPELTGHSTGDAGLAAAVRAAVGDQQGRRGLAVALIEDGRVRLAGVGDRTPDGAPVNTDTPFEIGSVTKTLTGMLLAEQAAAGVVRPDNQLHDLLPDVTGPAGQVTLAELASHRSGLPRLSTNSVGSFVRLYWASVTAGNPYTGQDRDRIVADAADTEPGGTRGKVTYSNFGMSLLGQALATKAGVPYPELLDRELLRPLGMSATVVARDAASLPAGHAEGAKVGGRPAAAWVGDGYAPAGVGVWSTVEDLSRLVVAMLAGTAPGADAATPRFDEDARTRVGYGWFTTRHGDRDIVWHNGGTGGFGAYLGFDRAAGRGVVVLGNTDRGVDAVGLRLLGVSGAEPRDDSGGLPGWLGAGLALALTFLGGLALVHTAGRGPDRLALLSATVWAALYLALGHRLGDWSVLPGWVWAAGVALTAAGTVTVARRWRALPPVAAGPAWRRWASAVLSAAGAVLAAIAVMA